MFTKKALYLNLLIAVIGIWYVFRPFPVIPRQKIVQKVDTHMILTSSNFANEEKIPKEFSCDGKGAHPAFSISIVPEGTKSLAMIVDDPDAPNGTFTHWLIWNIDPATTSIAQGAIPERAQEGMKYIPPCPPNGSHRYFFTLFALDTTIGLDGKANKAALEAAMAGHIIEQTNLIGSYERRSH